MVGLVFTKLRSQNQNNGCGEHYGGEKYRWTSVVTCCDASPVFASAEHPLDTVASFVAPLIVFDSRLARFAPRDTGTSSPVYQAFSEPVGALSPVGK